MKFERTIECWTAINVRTHEPMCDFVSKAPFFEEHEHELDKWIRDKAEAVKQGVFTDNDRAIKVKLTIILEVDGEQSKEFSWKPHFYWADWFEFMIIKNYHIFTDCHNWHEMVDRWRNPRKPEPKIPWWKW